MCDPLPPCGAGTSERNRLADGGFEAGSPSAAWEEYSDNFPSPICTAASCGLAAALAGDAWAFFGGTTVPETECAWAHRSLPQELIAATQKVAPGLFPDWHTACSTRGLKIRMADRLGRRKKETLS